MAAYEIARYERRKAELASEIEFAQQTGYTVSQFADGGDFDITDVHARQLQDELNECDLMIEHERSRTS